MTFLTAVVAYDRHITPTSVRYGAGHGGFSLCDPAVTPAQGQLFAVLPRPVGQGALAGVWGAAGILLSQLIA